MMRVIIQPDGMQRILENTPQYHIDVTDIRQLEVTEKEKALDEKRAEMSHQVIQTDEWPLFDVRITKIEDQKHRIHISFDNIIFDGWSMFHLLDEWAEVYRNGKAEMSITLSFRDYVLGLEQIKSTSAYEKDKKILGRPGGDFCGRTGSATCKERKPDYRAAFLSPERKTVTERMAVCKRRGGKTGGNAFCSFDECLCGDSPLVEQ